MLVNKPVFELFPLPSDYALISAVYRQVEPAPIASQAAYENSLFVEWDTLKRVYDHMTLISSSFISTTPVLPFLNLLLAALVAPALLSKLSFVQFVELKLGHTGFVTALNCSIKIFVIILFQHN